VGVDEEGNFQLFGDDDLSGRQRFSIQPIDNADLDPPELDEAT